MRTVNRRGLFLLFVAPFTDESPKNQLAATANAFHSRYRQWAEAFNKVKPGMIDAAENEAFQPLGELWRKVEHMRNLWIRGL